jgi:hypothetical protein
VNWPTTERPRLLVAFSAIALLIALVIGLLAFLDQNQRISNPQRYAERRCHGVLGKSFTPEQFSSCVAKERSKSTLSSILPLLVAGVIVAMLGISGLLVGREEVKRHDELMRKLRGED